MFNQAIVMGRVGKIDCKTLPTGTQLANVSIVTTKHGVKNGEKYEKPTWHNVTLFNKLAEVAQKYVSIGDVILVEGEMDNQRFQGSDGLERTKAYILAHQLKLLPRSAKPKPDSASHEVDHSVADDSWTDSDLPF